MSASCRRGPMMFRHRSSHGDPGSDRRKTEEFVMILLPRCLALALAVLAIQPAAAQTSDYPNRAVNFIVPFAPGGVTSLFARVLGSKLEQRLGKPFVIENRPGGGGVLAARS